MMKALEDARAAVSAIPWSSDLASLAARFHGRNAIDDGASTLGYRDLSARAHALAALLARRGAAFGDPIGIHLPNACDVVWASVAAVLAGAAETPLNWLCGEAELAWFARIVRLRLVITTRERVPVFQTLGVAALAIETLRDLPPGKPLPPVPSQHWSRILFTSGTTGRPKGIVYTHERRWLANQLQKATLPFVPSPGERIVLMTPFAHGASLLTYAWLDHGGEVVLLDGVQPARVRSLLERGSVSALFAPPTVIAKLADAFGAARFPGLRCLFTGTQALAPRLYARTRALFGEVVRITYGMTECVNPITVLGPADTAIHFASEPEGEGACVGWPAPGVELAIHGDDGAPMPPQEAGEVCLRAQHRAEGHIDAAGFHPIAEGEWTRTGDLGRIDARGRLWLIGRMTDVIKTGGYRVVPEEIETALANLPLCGQICVAALPSEYWGEVMVAAAENARPGWEEAAKQGVASLSRHKHPRAYVALAELPRNPQGKVSRAALREKILADYRLEDGPHPRLAPRSGALYCDDDPSARRRP